MTTTDVAQQTSAEVVSADHPGRLELVLAAVLMSATGIMLFATGLWALTFEGSMSRELTRALGGHTLTSVGALLVTVGAVLVLCVVGVLVGQAAYRWLGLVSRLIAIVIGIATAVSCVWLVAFYPGWAVTYAVLGSLIVYMLTLYEKALHSAQPWASLRAYLAKAFALNTKGIDVPRGVLVAGLLLITDVVCASQGQRRYFLSVAFGVLFVTLSDPGSGYLSRVRRMAAVGAVGALVTALGFGIGGGAWGWVVLATFVITAASGLLINIDLLTLLAGILLNVWFLVTLSIAVGLPSRVDPQPWNQALAWLIGSAFAVALMSISWVTRGRSHQTSHVPEIPADLPPIKLSKQIVAFVVIRAVAVAGSAAIAFGFSLNNADWMPLATLIAMKPTLQQSTLRATQRLLGTALGAGIAAVFLVTVTSLRTLEEIVVLLMGGGISIYGVNYALYTAAVAGAALIAIDLPNPTDLNAEGQRIFFTFAGIAIAVVVTVLGTLLQKRKTPTTAGPGSSSP